MSKVQTHFVSNEAETGPVVTRERTFISYDEHGNVIPADEANKKAKVYARTLLITDPTAGIQQYFIRTYQGLPLDPIGAEAQRNIWTRTELTKVDKATFNFFTLYLKTRNRLYLTRTQRSQINA